jgi:hypothetical protein
VLTSFNGHVPQLTLEARARQFGAFVLMVGKLAAKDEFDPVSAIVIQNKDELKIPLMLETVPTPKEFRDAIESLSPEQQEFCKAYRSMQLASSVFALAVIQIQPQLERVLNLDNGALTKEIGLNRELMEFFTKYQIPADLLSFDGPEDASSATKLEAVRSHAAAIRKVITAERAAELAAEEEKAKKQLYERTAAMEGMTFSAPNGFGAAPPTFAMEGMAMDSGFGAVPTSKSRKSRSRTKKKGGSKMMMRRECAAPAPPQQLAARSSAAVQPETLSTVTVTPAVVAPKAVERQTSSGSNSSGSADGNGAAGSGGMADLTKIPAALDARAALLDADSALRSTIITVGESWSKHAQNGLIASKSSIVESKLGKKERKKERASAFDLLDALTRSGLLSVHCAELHVVIASTHCFTRSLMATLVKDNVNPIDKVERSSLIVASTVQGCSPTELLEAAEYQRISAALKEEVKFLQIDDAGSSDNSDTDDIEGLMTALTAIANTPKSK